MWQRFFVVEHRAEIAHIEPTAARFAFVKVFGLAQWRPARLLANDLPVLDHRRHARDVILAAARFDRDLDFVVTGMFDREQDASIRFVREQSQQSSVLDVRLGEGRSAIPVGARSLMTAPAAA
jgi:hypothetical protein